MFEFTSAHAVQERDGFKQFLARVRGFLIFFPPRLQLLRSQMLPKPKSDNGSESTPSTPATPGTPATPAAAKPAPPRSAEPSIQEAKQRRAKFCAVVLVLIPSMQGSVASVIS